MTFAPKHVVAMVACVSAAAVLAPVGVMAATGITITDPFDNTRAARVTERGTLWVESRAGVASDSFHAAYQEVTNTGPSTFVVKQTTSRIAVTSFSLAVRGDTTTSSNAVRLQSRVRTSGSAPCASGVVSGWGESKTLATLTAHAGSSEQLLWNGPPLVLPTPPKGQAVCLLVQQFRYTGATATDVTVTGFAFT